MSNRQRRRSQETQQSKQIEQLAQEPQKSPPLAERQQAGISFEQRFEYRGPIPPDVLARYEQTELGREYIRSEFKQKEHRQFLERTVVVGDGKRANWGVFCAYTLALLFLASGVFLVINNHDTAGATIATAGLASLVGVFIYGTSTRKQERIEKTKLMVGHERGDE